MWERTLTGPVPREQPAARLTIWREGKPSRAELVVVGSQMTLAGKAYEVLAIDSPAKATGTVALRQGGFATTRAR